MTNELRNKLEGLATLETKHTNNNEGGWNWRTYYTDSIQGVYQKRTKIINCSGYTYVEDFGSVAPGAVSRYFGYFDSVKRSGVFSGGGYNKEDHSASSALVTLSKTMPGLTDEQRQELAAISESFKSGLSYAAREANKKAEEGAGSFWLEVVKIDSTSRGTYMGNYVHIYLIKK
jgi:hypothetical protein